MSTTLDTFTTGYVAALRENLPPEHRRAPFAPSTLAAILKDCAEDQAVGRRLNLAGNPEDRTSRAAGRAYWEERQTGNLRDAPPQTPHLGDDGKIYLREAK
jgi:hypothetical protein